MSERERERERERDRQTDRQTELQRERGERERESDSRARPTKYSVSKYGRLFLVVGRDSVKAEDDEGRLRRQNRSRRSWLTFYLRSYV